MVAQSYLEAFADALQAPLRGALCQSLPQLLDRWLTVGVSQLNGNGLPYYFQDLLWPVDCGVIPPQAPQRPPGGQCENVLYTVNVALYRPDGTISATIPFQNVVGPIAGITTDWQPDFFGNLFALTILFAPNDTEPPTPGQRRFGTWGPADPQQRARSVIVSIVRQDGQPDNCTGGPVPPPTPPPPPAGIPLPPFNFQLGPISVPINGSVNVGPVFFAPVLAKFLLPVTVNLSPSIAFPAGASFPVNIGLPDFNIEVPISFFPIDIDVLRTPEVRCTGSEAEFVERIIGVNVTVELEEKNRLTVINGEGVASDLLVPWAAVVRFIPPDFASNREAVDIPVKTGQQFVPCPWFYGADDYTVLANQGVLVEAVPRVARIADFVKPV